MTDDDGRLLLPTLAGVPAHAGGPGDHIGAQQDSTPVPSSVMRCIAMTLVLGLLAQALIPFGTASSPGASWWGLGVLLGLLVLAEQVAIDVDGQSRTSVSVVLLLSATILYGAVGGVVAAATFAIVGMFANHSPVYRMLFNLGNVLLSSASAGAVFWLLTERHQAGDGFRHLLLPAAIAGVVFYLVNVLLLCLVRGLAEQRNPVTIWREGFKWLWAHYAAFGVLAAFLSVAYLTFGISGVIAVATPVGMVQGMMNQYVRHTKAHVVTLHQINAELHESRDAMIRVLLRALDRRDEETEGHSQRVRSYAELIGRQHGLCADELLSLTTGALLHDIGKIGIPDTILRKPGKLTDEEWVLVRQHPLIGFGMIADIPFLSSAADIVLSHHEAFNGSGYPHGLVGNDIPLNARIFALADTLDAMSSDRPYRRALPLSMALAEIERCSGTQFDPAIVRTLLSIDHTELVRVPSATRVSVSTLDRLAERCEHEPAMSTADAPMSHVLASA